MWYRRKIEEESTERNLTEADGERSDVLETAVSQSSVASKKRSPDLSEHDQNVSSFKRVRMLSKTPPCLSKRGGDYNFKELERCVRELLANRFPKPPTISFPGT